MISHRGRRRPPGGIRVRRAAQPHNGLMPVDIFRIRAFAAENMVLFITMLVFVPVFFCCQASTLVVQGRRTTGGALSSVYFFLGFVVMSQVGGRILDRRGANLTGRNRLRSRGRGIWPLGQPGDMH